MVISVHLQDGVNLSWIVQEVLSFFSLLIARNRFQHTAHHTEGREHTAQHTEGREHTAHHTEGREHTAHHTESRRHTAHHTKGRELIAQPHKRS